MPKHTTPLPLDLSAALRASRDSADDKRKAEIDELLAGTPQLRYCPLSGFGTADYVEYYVELLEASGAFDTLKYSTAELSLNRDKLDLAGFAALGSAAAVLLTKAKKDAKTLRSLIVDHCQRFRVQVYDDETATWAPLYIDAAEAPDCGCVSAADIIDEHLDFGQMLNLVRALAGGVLRPLWSHLHSFGGETPPKSPPPSESDSQES